MIATPAAGGQVTTQWLLSFINTFTEANKITQGQSIVSHLDAAIRVLKRPGAVLELDPFVRAVDAEPKAQYRVQYDIGLTCLGNESLLGRGRNHLAQMCLMQGWEKLFFIDADAGWDWPMAKALIDSQSPIVGASCPLKVYVPGPGGMSTPPLNWKPLERDLHLFEPSKPVTVVELEKLAAAYGNAKEVAVKFLGTAFLCIHRSALLKLAETADHYGYPNSSSGQTETHWDFFKCSAVDNQYMSEDWGFCHQARDAGFEVRLNTEVVITHSGNHQYIAHRVPRPLDSQRDEQRRI